MLLKLTDEQYADITAAQNEHPLLAQLASCEAPTLSEAMDWLGRRQIAEHPHLQAFIDGVSESGVYQRAQDGDIDMDCNPLVSDSEDGAYVSAWIWVTNEDAGITQDDDDEEDEEDDDAAAD